jgi:hypothetical protein
MKIDNHRCRSERSLMTIRKWLLEAGDGPSTSVHIPSSRFDHISHHNSCFNKIIKRKRQKYYAKKTSIIDWFCEFIKKIFTVYDENQLKCDKKIHHYPIDDTSVSMITCSTCQFENIDLLYKPYICFI